MGSMLSVNNEMPVLTAFRLPHVAGLPHGFPPSGGVDGGAPVEGQPPLSQ